MSLAGDRKINLIWEVTQAIIAITLIIGYLSIIANAALKQVEPKVPESMTNVIFLIVGFYFSRTTRATNGDKPPTSASASAVTLGSR